MVVGEIDVVFEVFWVFFVDVEVVFVLCCSDVDLVEWEVCFCYCRGEDYCIVVSEVWFIEVSIMVDWGYRFCFDLEVVEVELSEYVVYEEVGFIGYFVCYD